MLMFFSYDIKVLSFCQSEMSFVSPIFDLSGVRWQVFLDFIGFQRLGFAQSKRNELKTFYNVLQ
ncbi:MAG: hypothetical protein EOO34_00455 [Cyanobacteriota bacterium]|nr:MAG: hypothetical protein EOO34_00455 [Cyanobacteriota bacterium]